MKKSNLYANCNNDVKKHVEWFKENFFVFNTESYQTKDWIKKEFEENMPDIRKKMYEEQFKIVMRIICDIVKGYIEKNDYSMFEY